jgi:hypothetical protein
MCHGEEDCNEFSCEFNVKVYCKCKNHFQMWKCYDLKKAQAKNSQVVIDCGDQCKSIERSKKIEQIFEGLVY